MYYLYSFTICTHFLFWSGKLNYLYLFLCANLRRRRFGGHRRLLNGQKQFEFGRQLVLRVQPIREVDTANATIRVDLHAQCFHIVGAVRAARKVGQIELNLVPALVESHRHRANERFDARRRLVVAGPEAPSNVLVVQHLYRKNRK